MTVNSVSKYIVQWANTASFSIYPNTPNFQLGTGWKGWAKKGYIPELPSMRTKRRTKMNLKELKIPKAIKIVMLKNCKNPQ